MVESWKHCRWEEGQEFRVSSTCESCTRYLCRVGGKIWNFNSISSIFKNIRHLSFQFILSSQLYSTWNGKCIVEKLSWLDCWRLVFSLRVTLIDECLVIAKAKGRYRREEVGVRREKTVCSWVPARAVPISQYLSPRNHCWISREKQTARTVHSKAIIFFSTIIGLGCLDQSWWLCWFLLRCTSLIGNSVRVKLGACYTTRASSPNHQTQRPLFPALHQRTTKTSGHGGEAVTNH